VAFAPAGWLAGQPKGIGERAMREKIEKRKLALASSSDSDASLVRISPWIEQALRYTDSMEERDEGA
jgi:hypothetical protein